MRGSCHVLHLAGNTAGGAKTQQEPHNCLHKKLAASRLQAKSTPSASSTAFDPQQQERSAM